MFRRLARRSARMPSRASASSASGSIPIQGDTFSISALHLSIKVPYFSNSGHKNEKVTSYLPDRRQMGELLRLAEQLLKGETGQSLWTSCFVSLAESRRVCKGTHPDHMWTSKCRMQNTLPSVARPGQRSEPVALCLAVISPFSGVPNPFREGVD